MRALHALTFLIGCGVPAAGTGLYEALSDRVARAVPERALAFLGDEAEPDMCRAEQSGRPRPPRRPRDTPIKALAAFADSGGWRIDGRVRQDGSFTTSMSDRNPAAPGSLYVQLDNEGGRTTQLTVGAFGAELFYSENFDGPDWEAATTARRAHRVRESMMRYARLSDGRCGARLSSLDQAFASFDRAFRQFDRRAP